MYISVCVSMRYVSLPYRVSIWMYVGYAGG